MKRTWCRTLGPSAVLFAALKAHGTYIDLNLLSFTDSFKADTNTTVSRTMYDIGVGIPLGKTNQWFWALSFGSCSFSDQSTTTTTFSVTDLGIKLGGFWNKQKSWLTTITYNLDSKAKYNNGTSPVELRGSSLKLDLGYVFWPNDTFGIAAKIFYYAPSFKESIASNTLTTINYTRSTIYPSVSIIVSF